VSISKEEWYYIGSASMGRSKVRHFRHLQSPHRRWSTFGWLASSEQKSPDEGRVNLDLRLWVFYIKLACLLPIACASSMAGFSPSSHTLLQRVWLQWARGILKGLQTVNEGVKLPILSTGWSTGLAGVQRRRDVGALYFFINIGINILLDADLGSA